MNESKNLPILFIIFNRSEIAIKSFQRIKEFKPKRLFIASDGPREDIKGEIELVNLTREIILSKIDWDCEVKTHFQDYNLGCGQGVFTAINWFFEEVEYGVILEDDCVAESSFFDYAFQMLELFKDDLRIGMIAGTNPMTSFSYPYSIIFSKYKSCWGWGSWKRAWQNMDFNMVWRNSPQANDIIANCGYLNKDKRTWIYKINCIDNKYVSAWDWQWYFSLSAQNQLCIYPAVNLISNIGNDEQATHTSLSDITLPSYPLEFPLRLPEFVVPCLAFDKDFFTHSETWFAKLARLVPHSIKMKIKTIIRNK